MSISMHASPAGHYRCNFAFDSTNLPRIYHLFYIDTCSISSLSRYLPSLRISHTISPNDIFHEEIKEDAEPRQKFNLNTKSSATFKQKQDSLREHRCESERKFEEKKRKSRKTKDEPFICGMISSTFHRTTPIARKTINQDSHLNLRNRSQPTNSQFYRATTQTSLPRERSDEFNCTNMRLEDLRPRRKTAFPTGGLKVRDLLDVKVRPEYQGASAEKCLRGTSQIRSLTSYPVANKGPLSFPCRSFKVELRMFL
jgi:hypothetical protein